MLFAATLLVLPGVTHATAGFSCAANDDAVTFSLGGAYARSIGGGIANFGGDAELKLPGIPQDALKPTFETRHLNENWFENRDLKLAAQWQSARQDRSTEIALLIETRRGRDEDAPYRGRYRLVIFLPDGGGKPREIRGRVTCVAE